MNESSELFSNPTIHPRDLPSVENLDWIALEPDYKTVRYLSSSLFSVGLLVFATVAYFWFAAELGRVGIAGYILVALLAVWNVLYHGISFHYMGYAIREKDISYKSGWWWRSTSTIPFNRVQHADIKQGLIDRQFNLAKLTVYTAGGQSTDLEIPGLLPDTAEKLKTFILQSTEQAIEQT